MSIIKTTDFVGEINLSQNQYNVTDIQESIDRVTEDVLEALMGDKLYNEFIADLVNDVPQTAKYVNLLDGETYTDNCGYVKNYKGLKRMLRYFIYSDFIYNYQVSTIAGTVRNDDENSTQVSGWKLRNISNKMYDKGVMLYFDTLRFICDKEDTYFSDITNWTYKKLRYKSKLLTRNVK